MSDRGRTAILSLALLAMPCAAEPPAPLTLRTAVARALERDPTYLAAARGADEAAAGAAAASSAFRPQFFVTSTPGVTTGLPLSVAGEPPAAAGARLRLMLWDPSLKADAAAASGKAAGAEAALEGARRETIRRTADAFVRYVEAERRVGIARRRLSAREAIGVRIAALAREGRVLPLLAERSALETERAEGRVAAAESGRRLAASDLGTLTGLPEGAEIALPEKPLRELPESAPGDSGAAAVASDPVAKALGAEVAAASRAAGLEDRWFKPQIVAEARYLYVPPYYNYDQYYVKVDTNTAAAGVSFILPVLSGGLDGARAAAARAHEARLREERRAREEEVARLARAASVEAEISARDLSLAQKEEKLAREALRIATALEGEGRGEPDGVLRAELELADAEEATSRAAEAAALSRLSLLARDGELDALAPASPKR